MKAPVNRVKGLAFFAKFQINILICPATPRKERTSVLPLNFRGSQDNILDGMHSVLQIQGIEDHITVYHASFVDFLYNKSQSKDSFIDQAVHCQPLVCGWLSLLLNPDIYKSWEQEDPNPGDKLIAVCNTVRAELSHIFTLLWKRHSHHPTYFAEEFYVIPKCLQSLSGIDLHGLLESIQVSVDCEGINFKGFSPVSCLQNILFWRITHISIPWPRHSWRISYSPAIISNYNLPCACAAKLLAEPIVCCTRKPTIFHISVRRVIVETLQSELDSYAQESHTHSWLRLNNILEWCSADPQLLQYSGLMQFINFGSWTFSLSNESIVLDWLKMFPPAYSKLVQPQIDKVTGMISTWNQNLEEFKETERDRDFEDWIADEMREMGKLIYSDLQKHKKSRKASQLPNQAPE
ncbi:hypothetical protein L218DRAFT_1003217 [Marasmius fiardii PR-910]|nr:hypothetical protein L218DRAFT_1003217 [Marasmius fiardii PR-910]